MKAQTKKLIIGGVIAMAVAASIMLLIKKKRSRNLLSLSGTASTTTKSSSKIDGVVYPLQYGSGYSNPSENTAVKKLQQALNTKIGLKPYLNIEPLDVDGKFGPKTEAASEKILGVKQVSYSLYQELLSQTVTTVLGLIP